MTSLIDRNHCSTLLITCSDFRFKSAERRFAEAAGMADDYDLIALPGASRALVQSRSAAMREALREEMALLWQVHQYSRVLLLNHVSCRAYDDLATPENELEVHAGHLRQAVGVVEGMFNGVGADPYIVDYVDGDFVVVKVAMSEA
jgi:hypothetical protein